MSNAMMPIAPEALQYRTLLFDLSKPVTMTPEMFDEVWPYVNSVYTKLQSEMLRAYGTVRVQKYECRLRNSKKSSSAKEAPGNKVIKHRHSSIRDQNLCHVRIKVSRPMDTNLPVTIERLDEHMHTHDIEESFQIKKPSILINCITTKVAKNYSASQVLHALRGAGTAEGAERLGDIGGSSLTRFVICKPRYSRSIVPRLTLLP